MNRGNMACELPVKAACDDDITIDHEEKEVQQKMLALSS
jgi:hypothetical protein